MAGATGATVIAGQAAVPLYQEAFVAESSVVPDGVDASAIEIVGVGADPVTIADPVSPVTVHAFPNPHAEDYVLVDAAGALWIVDTSLRRPELHSRVSSPTSSRDKVQRSSRPSEATVALPHGRS